MLAGFHTWECGRRPLEMMLVGMKRRRLSIAAITSCSLRAEFKGPTVRTPAKCRRTLIPADARVGSWAYAPQGMGASD